MDNQMLIIGPFKESEGPTRRLIFELLALLAKVIQ